MAGIFKRCIDPHGKAQDVTNVGLSAHSNGVSQPLARELLKKDRKISSR